MEVPWIEGGLILRTHRPLQEGLRPLFRRFKPEGRAKSQNPSSTTRRIATGALKLYLLALHHSEPIVHYKKDCDVAYCPVKFFLFHTQNPSSTTRRIATSRGGSAGLWPACSEPIVHYKKDCDSVPDICYPPRCRAQNPSSTTRRIATPLRRDLLRSGQSQNPSSTTRRIATRWTVMLVIWKTAQNPSSTTRRIATFPLFRAEPEGKASEPIVHYKKDCDWGASFAAFIAAISEPIVHYKKDCDGDVEDGGV